MRRAEHPASDCLSWATSAGGADQSGAIGRPQIARSRGSGAHPEEGPRGASRTCRRRSAAVAVRARDGGIAGQLLQEEGAAAGFARDLLVLPSRCGDPDRQQRVNEGAGFRIRHRFEREGRATDSDRRLASSPAGRACPRLLRSGTTPASAGQGHRRPQQFLEQQRPVGVGPMEVVDEDDDRRRSAMRARSSRSAPNAAASRAEGLGDRRLRSRQALAMAGTRSIPGTGAAARPRHRAACCSASGPEASPGSGTGCRPRRRAPCRAPIRARSTGRTAPPRVVTTSSAEKCPHQRALADARRPAHIDGRRRGRARQLQRRRSSTSSSRARPTKGLPRFAAVAGRTIAGAVGRRAAQRVTT